MKNSNDNVNIFNLGAKDYCEVAQIQSDGSLLSSGLTPKLSYTGGERGWVGDNPFVYLDTKKIRALGWQENQSIR